MTALRPIIRSALLAGCLAAANPASAQSLTPGFPLTDSAPGSPDFKRQFEASFALHPSAEPPLTPEDRSLYRKIEPHLQKGETDEAIALLERERDALKRPAFAYLLGNLHYQADNLEAAEKALRQAVEAYPAFLRAHRTLGLVFIRTERFAEAAETWQKVVALGGGDAQSYGLLGYAWLNLDRMSSALTAYRMARMFDPERIDFRRGEAHALWSMGAYPEAIALLDELIADQPGQPEFWLLQANALMRQQRYREALVNLEVVRGLGSASADVLALLGDLYLREDMLDLALGAYRDCLASGPLNDPSRLLRPLEPLLAAGRAGEAEDYLKQVQARHADLAAPALELALARIDLERSQTEAARQRVETVLENLPLHPEANLLLGRIHIADGRSEEALMCLERVRGDERAEREALLEQARLHIRERQPERALPLLRQVQARAPHPRLQAYIQSLLDQQAAPVVP